MKIYELLNKSSLILLQKIKNRKSAFRESEIILLSTINKPKEYLYLNLRNEIDKKTTTKFVKKIRKRVGGYPLQYLINHDFFYGRKFHLKKGVFIPRPDSETLIDATKKIKNIYSCIDIGCGSGCLGITIKLEIPCIKKITLIDKSKKAINITRENAAYYKLNADIIHSCFFKYILKFKTKYDIAVCNPPYIAPQLYNKLQKEVKYEPKKALLAKNEGYDFYLKLSLYGNKFLKPGGFLVLESGDNMSDNIKKIFNKNWFFLFSIKDFNNIERALVFQLIY